MIRMGWRGSRRTARALVVLVGITLIGCGDQAPKEDRSSATEATLTKLQQQLAVYRLDLGRYPSTRQGLSALCSPPATETALSTPEPRAARQWHGPYLGKDHLLDAWGHPIRYEHGADQYLLTSNGPDGEPDTADDIRLSSTSDDQDL